MARADALTLMWVNKTASSISLSHSHDIERLEILSQAQRSSRPRKTPRKEQPNAPCSTKRWHRQTCRRLPRWDPKERQSRANQRERLPALSSMPILGYDATWKTSERRGVHLFLHTTVLEIVYLQHEHTFWTQTVPCMARHHAVIRHLVVAIASTHEFILDNGKSSTDLFALRQCNNAIALLRTLPGLPLPLLLVSCILVAAYSLLRCDLAQAELAIESGLKIAAPTARQDIQNEHRQHPKTPNGDVQSTVPDPHAILIQLRQRHGFKLWAARVAYRYETITDCQDALEVETSWIQYPFHNKEQAITAWKNLMIQAIAKVTRNLARGAYLDPQCSVAKSIGQQLDLLISYWQSLYDQTALECEEERLVLKQLRIGINHTVLLFRNKLVRPVEGFFDNDLDICENSISLAEDLLTARKKGHSLLYMDRIVNGALVGLCLCVQSLALRQKAISLLQEQALEEDGLVHWMRGAVLQVVKSVEDDILLRAKSGNSDSSAPTWMIIVNVSYIQATKNMRVEYTIARDDHLVHTADRSVEWNLWPGRPLSVDDISSCIEGIMTAYRMYSKPRPSQARRGYVRKISHNGAPMPIIWEDGY